MSFKDVVEGKKQWRKHMARVNVLPNDYQIVYKEIQKYLFKIGPVEPDYGTNVLADILEHFEEGAASGKDVFDVTGKDVAAFCDELVKGSKTYADIYQESVNQKVAKAIKKDAGRA
jgi:DNA-binding ferritin-like protein (Dps family)